MIWGLPLHSWEEIMRGSLMAVGAFGLIAGVATWFVVSLTRAESEATKSEYESYKLTVEGKVADAKKEGIEAGKTAGNALVRAAELEKEAANARLETERLKALVAWRTISPEDAKALVAELAKGSGEIDLAFTPSDPESEYFALKIIGNGGFAAVNNSSGEIKWHVYMRPWVSNGMFFGIAIPGPETEQVKIIRRAFTAAHIPFSTSDPPEESPPIIVGAGLSYTPAPKHSALIVVGLKNPPL
jgi:hypothetical protein